MKTIFGALIAMALVVPAVSFAAEATGKITKWDGRERKVTLELANGNELVCSFDKKVQPPQTLAVNRSAEVTYASKGGMNTCSSLRLK